MKKIINIVAGGPEEYIPNLTTYLDEEAIWVGVDRGVITLLRHGIEPSIAFGDFDSVTADELELIKKQVDELKLFNPVKNETDAELALLWAIAQEPPKIQLFGATGGRLDHCFANVQLMIKPLIEKNHVPVYMIDRKNVLSVKGPGTHTIQKDAKRYVSFMPVTFNVTNLTLTGFKYPLEDRHISMGSTLCISNELISDYGTFSFSEGILLVIRSDD